MFELEKTAANIPLKTRRDCALFGAVVFATVLVLCFIVGFILLALFQRDVFRWCDPSKILLRHLALALQPVMVLGAWLGFQNYRLAVGSVNVKESGCFLWTALVLLLSPVTTFIYFHWQFRQYALVTAPVGWAFTGFYSAAFVLLCWGVNLRSVFGLDFLPLIFILLSLLIADCATVKIIADWHHAKRLAPPTSHKIQFSLGTLVLVVLDIGLWLTLLKWLSR